MQEFKIGPDILNELYPQKENWSHKGDSGKLLVIAGSNLYTGCPALVGLSAFRSGVDLVHILTPEASAKTVASFSPNLIVESVKGNHFTSKSTKAVLKMAADFDAVVIGSGLGKHQETERFVRQFLNKSDDMCVVDADAIPAIAGYQLDKNFVVTPHAKEFEVLTGQKPKNTTEERIKLVAKWAKKLSATILLKGHTDVISNGKDFAVNKTGNPYMTVGGTGDVLNGICGALLAKGLKPFKAACGAAYISGLAGDLAAEKLGAGLMATDVIEAIPKVLKKV